MCLIIIDRLRSYADGRKDTYIYTAEWSLWEQQIAVNEVEHKKSITCRATSDFPELFPVECINSNIRYTGGDELGYLYKEIYWGTSPDDLMPLPNSLNSENVLAKHDELRSTYNSARANTRYTTKLKRLLSEYPYDWRSIDDRHKPLLLLTEPHTFLYFKFVDIFGFESETVQAVVADCGASRSTLKCR